ncbi:MAG: hypothetical protein ACREWG_00540 [Gammaproteobacteria bacterium]
MVEKRLADDQFFEELAATTEREYRAPTRVKSRLYSALMQAAQNAGTLRSLTATKAAGHGLCFWETAMQTLPLGERVDRFNHCRVCHGRVVGENVEDAPLPWAHCPYAEFQKK